MEQNITFIKIRTQVCSLLFATETYVRTEVFAAKSLENLDTYKCNNGMMVIAESARFRGNLGS